MINFNNWRKFQIFQISTKHFRAKTIFDFFLKVKKLLIFGSVILVLLKNI